MAFVFEKVPEKDYKFFKSMGLKNCWGNGSFSLSKDTKWCADRDRNAYLVRIGGGFNDMPNFHDFWWNGYAIPLPVIHTLLRYLTKFKQYCICFPSNQILILSNFFHLNFSQCIILKLICINSKLNFFILS